MDLYPIYLMSSFALGAGCTLAGAGLAGFLVYRATTREPLLAQKLPKGRAFVAKRPEESVEKEASGIAGLLTPLMGRFASRADALIDNDAKAAPRVRQRFDPEGDTMVPGGGDG